MPRPEHLDILKQGVRRWNEWRRENLRLSPDLSYAHFSGADLRSADLTGVTLYRADLSGADLSNTIFVQAYLMRTNFSRAILKGANLEEAYLNEAILEDADLEGAYLVDTNFSGANLSGANLSRARMEGTHFANVDLHMAKGLETIEHRGPSTIGIDTIYRSKGNIPEVFLRNAGVPKPFIENMKSLIGAMSPIDYYSCFISYSSRDDDFASRLHADLQSKAVRCWFAPEDLKIGDKFWHRIDESIRLYDKLLVVLSEHSVQSDWVEREVMAALEKEKQGKTVLFPITLDDAVKDCTAPWAADLRRQRHIGDFRRWKSHDDYQKALERLLRDLKASS